MNWIELLKQFGIAVAAVFFVKWIFFDLPRIIRRYNRKNTRRNINFLNEELCRLDEEVNAIKKMLWEGRDFDIADKIDNLEKLINGYRDGGHFIPGHLQRIQELERKITLLETFTGGMASKSDSP